MADNVLTDEQIEEAKKHTKYTTEHVLHEHNDCIRIAYEWLDAQRATVRPTKRPCALKHLIEQWGARYISQSDVEVAAHMHPRIKGGYPLYNISTKLIWPAEDRLTGIGEAYSQPSYRERQMAETYTSKEQPDE
jgi:hypothetical protein